MPVNEPVHLPRRKKECSQKISMAISQALLERGQSSEAILTTFDEDIPVTGDVGLIHAKPAPNPPGPHPSPRWGPATSRSLISQDCVQSLRGTCVCSPLELLYTCTQAQPHWMT